MSPEIDGGPADKNLSVRDVFIAHALQGLLSNDRLYHVAIAVGNDSGVAEMAIAYADAVMEARKA